MAATVLSGLVNPQVMGQLIQAKLTDYIKFAPVSTVDTTLVGTPGNTITLPTYAYIGDAVDVAEGVDIVPAVLTATSASVAIKKAGKGVEITDESVLSGYGDPVSQAADQLRLAIASKIDTDIVTVLNNIGVGMTLDSSTLLITSAIISDALAKFGETMDIPSVLFIAPAQLAKLRKDPEFISASALGNQVIMTGVIGSIYGAQVVVSNRVPVAAGVYSNFIVQPGAVGIYLKRDVQVETDRNILGKKTIITADEHYAVYVANASKAVKLKTKV